MIRAQRFKMTLLYLVHFIELQIAKIGYDTMHMFAT